MKAHPLPWASIGLLALGTAGLGAGLLTAPGWLSLLIVGSVCLGLGWLWLSQELATHSVQIEALATAVDDAADRVEDLSTSLPLRAPRSVFTAPPAPMAGASPGPEVDLAAPVAPSATATPTLTAAAPAPLAVATLVPADTNPAAVPAGAAPAGEADSSAPLTDAVLAAAPAAPAAPQPKRLMAQIFAQVTTYQNGEVPVSQQVPIRFFQR